MSEAQVHGRSRRRSREEADRLVVEYEQSGQTRRAFCGERGILPATLDNYRKRRAFAACVEPVDPDIPSTEIDPPSTSRPAIAFVPLEVIESPAAEQTVTPHEMNQRSALFVELNRGRRIGVMRGFDTPTLTRLIAVLEQV